MGGSSSKQKTSVNKAIIVEENITEIDINERFDKEVKFIQIEINKLENKFNEFQTLMNIQKQKEENTNKILEKRGIELYEYYMKLILTIDQYVGLEETRRKKRKSYVIFIQKRLDLVEQLQNQLRDKQTNQSES
ncbi:hypothetical protein EDI_044430 [Entamoeba dispar SAW760]|uniref:BAG domain-containing protein n=1 Tax=Entamoeba dispar (strain ATCC PRA-260 / SAW760) TaxID=370354 RepID=B0EHU3_ENTDS|nr:uncharacterized protein EDI_044430 [Entamoeba dispar SAW760]EDR25887.1 hypothetical protein EDI_044430 [Entamoeba dispar SAW760]|eukprot:EDR25887.1 hypothetical protein EDI_044430 [Entamoeba dispar SAW760]